MSQRLLDPTKWTWCILLLTSGPIWSPVSSITVRPPSKIPSTVESQAKFFQDFFSVQLSPYKIEFGHVCEDPNTWEQRYEKKDFKNHRDMGKVRWGDKKGGYGEHYWDLNHAGYTGNHGNDDYDDGSYHEDPQDEEIKGQSNNYESEKYNSQDPSYYDESGRSKRAHSRIQIQSQQDESNPEQKPKKTETNIANLNILKDKANVANDIELMKAFLNNRRQRHVREQYDDEPLRPKDHKHIDLVVNQKLNDNYKDTVKSSEDKHNVPYGGRARFRQQLNSDAPAATTISRLYLERSTGNIIDRTTGKMYILQPVPLNNKLN